MGWLGTVEVAIAAVVLLVLAPLVALYCRRRWLSSHGGVFDCALRLYRTGKGTGWSTGIARYVDDELQWFRTFSLSSKPRVVLTRTATSSLGTREPSPAESALMFGGDRIIQLVDQTPTPAKTWELAMTPPAVTGLMSWLEAAPPGGDRYSGLDMRE